MQLMWAQNPVIRVVHPADSLARTLFISLVALVPLHISAIIACRGAIDGMRQHWFHDHRHPPRRLDVSTGATVRKGHAAKACQLGS